MKQTKAARYGSSRGRGFRADQIIIGDDELDIATEHRNNVIAAFVRFGIGRGLVVHDTGDELQMVRLCETIWPGERVTKLRQAIEAERLPQNRPFATLPKHPCKSAAVVAVPL